MNDEILSTATQQDQDKTQSPHNNTKQWINNNKNTALERAAAEATGCD